MSRAASLLEEVVNGVAALQAMQESFMEKASGFISQETAFRINNCQRQMNVIRTSQNMHSLIQGLIDAARTLHASGDVTSCYGIIEEIETLIQKARGI